MTLDEIIASIKRMTNRELLQEHLNAKDDVLYREAIEEEMLIRMGE